MLRMPQLCVMLAWLGTTPLAPAQDNVPKDLRDWIHIISGGAPELLKLAPIHIEFERAGVGVPDAATIQFMRASVAGHPDHPDTSKLRTIESRLAHTDVSHVRLWVGNSMWRVATYYGNKPDQFFDLGATSDAVWNLLPDGISVSSRISPGQNDYSIVAMRLIDDGAYLFSGGMHLVSKSTHPWKFDAIELQGTHWTARASNPMAAREASPPRASGIKAGYSGLLTAFPAATGSATPSKHTHLQRQDGVVSTFRRTRWPPR